MTAKHAALGGADVLIIEKRQEVGSPVRCGEGFSVDWLPKVGLKPDKRWLVNTVESGRMYSPGGHCFKFGAAMGGNEMGAVIERDIFDKCLAEDAIKAGAKLQLKTACMGLERKDGVVRMAVDHIGERKHLECKVVVGADGYESQVGRWIGIDTNIDPKDVMTCFQYRMIGIDVDPKINDFYISNAKMPGGYAWVFCKSADMANVGIGVQASRITEPGAPKRYLDKFISEHPHLAKGFATEAVAGGVSVCQPIDRTVADNVMLVGDSARQIDPMTGGGIAHACKAGCVAGRVAAEAIVAKDYSAEFFQRYEKGWRDIFENVLWRNYMAKEKVQAMSDETMDKIIESLSLVQIDQLSIFGILDAVRRKYPELVKEFEEFL